MSLLDKFYTWTNFTFRPFSRFWWKDVWYTHVSSRLWPRNKWLTKKIPRTWSDKNHLLEIVVIECLKHYVDKDGENCFNVIVTEHESYREVYIELKKYYELATVKLPALQKKLNEEWDKVPHRSLADINNSQPGDYDRIYGSINQLEKEINDLQTEIMVWVIKNRAWLRT